jgi:glycosyltransferase involved in cell wall biosynthesis
MARALVARGHGVTILLPPWQNPEDAGRIQVVDGVTVENIGLPHRISGPWHLVLAARLAHRGLGFNPDVIHAFKPKAYSGLAHYLLHSLASRRRPPIVVDTDDWEGHGGWNELGAYTPLQKAFFAWQERWGLRHADAVTTASRTLQSLVWAAGTPPARTFYVPNSTLVPEGSGNSRGVARGTDDPVILLYTRFVEFSVQRMLDLLLQIVRAVPSARLLVVGSGLRGEAGQLASLAADAGLSRALEFSAWDPVSMGNQFARAALAIYPLDDTLVNRSKSPVKLLELLAHGIAVVAERVGEAGEYIRHGETGLLVRAGDAAAFARAVTSLLDAPEERARLGSAAARDIRRRLSWHRTVGSVLEAYSAAGAPV